MKRTYTRIQTKKAVALSVLTGKYTVGQAALLAHVTPNVVNRWVHVYGREMLATLRSKQ